MGVETKPSARPRICVDKTIRRRSAMALSEGAKIHRARLARMRRWAIDGVTAPLVAGAELVRADAQKSIRDGSVSGAGHIPSRPGQPPNADTRRLDLSIDIEVSASRKSARVISRAPYSAYLEFGTSRMAERPFMRPALRRNRNRIVYGFVQGPNGINRVIKG